MARDPIEQRGYTPVVPDDLNDPARYGQSVETTKDAFVLELRKFFRTTQFTTAKRVELVNVEKYAIGFGTGLDPYATYVQIVQDFPDILERLPHIAVTAASGTNRRMGVGRPVIAATQLQPRVESANEGPYALANATTQRTDLTASGPGPYSVLISGTFFSEATFAELAATLNTELDLIIRVLFENQTIILEGRIVGEAFTVANAGNVAVNVVRAASAVTGPDEVHYRTTEYRGAEPREHVVRFNANRFPNQAPDLATAADVARVWNEQALYSTAKTTPIGNGIGLRLLAGGRAGRASEIEILPATTDNALAVLGLGARGSLAGGSVTASAFDVQWTLTVPGAGFVAAMEGRYIWLEGANAGRHLIVAVASADEIVFESEDGQPEAGMSGTWFVGFRDDDTNPDRPIMNRYHEAAQFNISIDIYAESPNVRRELSDLVWGYFASFAEMQHFNIMGRGIFDEQYPDEIYQIVIHQEVATQADVELARGQDQKGKIQGARLSIPVTTYYFLDRPVTALTGPRSGQSWTANLEEDDTIVRPT